MADRETLPVHLGPMARSMVETFADLTLPQQRYVLALISEIVAQNEATERLVAEARLAIIDQHKDHA